MTILSGIMLTFRYNETDFYASPGPSGVELKGPFWHPLRLLSNLTAWNMFILVPIFYCTIFKFRKSQDLTAGTYILNFFKGPYRPKSIQKIPTFDILSGSKTTL